MIRFCAFSILFFLTFALPSCTVSKQIKELSQTATSAYEQEDYREAFNDYDELIALKESRNKAVDGETYFKAGVAAWRISKVDEAIQNLENAKRSSYSDEKLYSTLARAYLEIDNLSREIINLEAYLEKFPSGIGIDEVKKQLFIAYDRSENWQPGYDLWSDLTEEQKSEARIIRSYLNISKALGKTNEVVPLAKQLLSIDPNDMVALELLAMEYYNMAEESYKTEMRAYQDNRTNRQYRQLLKALDVINENFHTSRKYFEQLYSQNPEPRFAKYLGNIYTRFDNKQKADYYYKKADE